MPHIPLRVSPIDDEAPPVPSADFGCEEEEQAMDDRVITSVVMRRPSDAFVDIGAPHAVMNKITRSRSLRNFADEMAESDCVEHSDSDDELAEVDMVTQLSVSTPPLRTQHDLVC